MLAFKASVWIYSDFLNKSFDYKNGLLIKLFVFHPNLISDKQKIIWRTVQILDNQPETSLGGGNWGIASGVFESEHVYFQIKRLVKSELK